MCVRVVSALKNRKTGGFLLFLYMASLKILQLVQ
jgi:hypothetical protein